jgi:acetyltransferase
MSPDALPASAQPRYPREWEHHAVMRSGLRVFVRPLRPEDQALYPDFLHDVSTDDLRLRFLAPLREVSPELIHRLTHIDYDTAMAFIALDEASGKMLGVVRLHQENDPGDAEYAVLVRSNLKGHGLGWLLMSRIIEYAKAKGLNRIHGEVLAENTTMLAMCAEMGFRITDDPSERGVKRVTLWLKGDHAPPA